MARQRLQQGYWAKELAKIRRLDREARRKSGSNNPEHYMRAKIYVDTQSFAGKKGEPYTDSTHKAAHRYLDVREGVSEEIAKEQHMTPAEVAAQLVMDELIEQDMHPKECADILRGIDIGKIALRLTSKS